MNGNKFLLDTNAILYILGGDETLAELLYKKALYLSIISEIELLSYKKITAREKQKIKKFIAGFMVVNINDSIRDQTIEIKRSTLLKLPDSIIAASAKVFEIPLVTSDKQFKKVTGLDLLYYEK
jgi:hypothetical protein